MKKTIRISEEDLIKIIKRQLSEDLDTGFAGFQRRMQTRKDNKATPEGQQKYNPSVEAGIGRVFNANERLLEYINYFQNQYKKIWHNDLNSIRTKNTKQSKDYGDHTERIDNANAQLAAIQAKLEETRKLIETYKRDFQLQKAY